MARAEKWFVLLIGLQAAHSVEEYAYRLYADFPPARFVSGLFSPDLRVGFVFANALLVGLGVLSWLGPVRQRWAVAPAVLWGWALLELVNGIGHPLRSVLAGRYTAGTVTALGLLAVAIVLMRELAAHTESGSRPDVPGRVSL